MPKVIFSNSFTYNWHIGADDLLAYYERPAAFFPKSAQEHSPYYDMYDYMANNEKSDGVFTADSDLLSAAEIDKYREFEKVSQSEGCPKYVQVVSFDNTFLEENHIMINGVVDRSKLRNVFRQAMAALIESEPKFQNDNCYWTAAIHTNTDNIHIHSSLLEYHRTEDRQKKYKDADMISVQAMNRLKSVVASRMIEKNDRTKEHTRIERELLLPSLKKSFTNTTEQMSELRRILPPEGGWQYNRPKMKRYCPQIDAVVNNIISSNDDLNKLFCRYKQSLDSLADYYKEFYGKGEHDQYLSYTANKLDDFYARAGNSLLKYLSEIDLSYRQGRIALKEGDIQRAEQKLMLAVERKDDKAEYELGKLYITCYVGDKDRFEKGIALLEKQAQNNNVSALYALGARYLSEKKTTSKGLEYLKRAADEYDHEQAQYTLGKYYLDKDKLQNAAKYLTAAAKKDNSFAYYKLGQLHSKQGKADKAMQCYHKASQLGNEYAAKMIAQRNESAAQWSRKRAAAQRHYRAKAQMKSAQSALDSIYKASEQHLREMQREFEFENNIVYDSGIDYSL